MKKLFFISASVLLFFMLAFTLANAAEKTKIKYITSVYADAAGIGLQHPEGLTCSNDAFIVADTGNSRIVRYQLQQGGIPAGGTEVKLASSAPLFVQAGTSGNTYVLDGKERRIAVLDTDGNSKGFFVPKGVPDSENIVPRSFKITPNGKIYLLDIFGERVLVLDEKGEYIKAIAFPKEYGAFSDLAVGPHGTVFIIDSVEAIVYSAAEGAEQFSGMTKSLKKYMNFPTSLTVADGIIYLVDQYGSGLALIGRDGSFLERKLSLGWKESFLYYPTQICINDDGIIFIADRSNSRIQLFTLVEK